MGNYIKTKDGVILLVHSIQSISVERGDDMSNFISLYEHDKYLAKERLVALESKLNSRFANEGKITKEIDELKKNIERLEQRIAKRIVTGKQIGRAHV